MKLIDYTFGRFQIGLDKRLKEIPENAADSEDLRRERRQLQQKTERNCVAIADAGHSPVLLRKLGDLEAQIAAIDQKLDASRPVHLSSTVCELRKFVTRKFESAANFVARRCTRRETGARPTRWAARAHARANAPYMTFQGGLRFFRQMM